MSTTMGSPRRTKPDRIAGGSATRERAAKSEAGMHACPSCGSLLVQPVEWDELGEGHWRVGLRCPECDWWGRESYSQAEVDRYDEELDRGGLELKGDLRALTRANMEEELDRFAMALAKDSILPEDF
jgi:hypothetical protein